MSSQLPFPPLGFDQLSREQQFDYIDELINYVGPNDTYVEIPEWHLEIIDERMARYNEFGMEGTSWEEFEKKLDSLFEHELNKRKPAK